MYFYYCLSAVAAIFLIALVLNIILLKKKLLTPTNKFYLIVCTVLAMIGAVLIPLLAKVMIKVLYFSIFDALIISFVIFVVLAWLLLKFIMKKRKTAEDKNDNIDPIGNGEVQAEVQTEARPMTQTEAPQQEVQPETQPEAPQPEVQPETRPDALTLADLLDKASECKINHELNQAISLYESALLCDPDPELMTWIVIDLSSLYKITNQRELIIKLLNSNYSKLLNEEIKKDILRNI